MLEAMDRDEVARSIAEVSLLRGSFTLRSGRTSRYYLDKYLFTTQPRILRALGRMLGERIGTIERDTGKRVERLAGAELGGVPLVTAASLETGLPCVLIRNQRKGYGTERRLEGVLGAGETVLVVEDVATSGGQCVEAIRVLREAGARVLAVIATIDRQEGAREAVQGESVRFEALFTKRDLGIDD